MKSKLIKLGDFHTRQKKSARLLEHVKKMPHRHNKR